MFVNNHLYFYFLKSVHYISQIIIYQYLNYTLKTLVNKTFYILFLRRNNTFYLWIEVDKRNLLKEKKKFSQAWCWHLGHLSIVFEKKHDLLFMD